MIERKEPKIVREVTGDVTKFVDPLKTQTLRHGLRRLGVEAHSSPSYAGKEMILAKVGLHRINKYGAALNSQYQSLTIEEARQFRDNLNLAIVEAERLESEVLKSARIEMQS